MTLPGSWPTQHYTSLESGIDFIHRSWEQGTQHWFDLGIYWTQVVIRRPEHIEWEPCLASCRAWQLIPWMWLLRFLLLPAQPPVAAPASDQNHPKSPLDMWSLFGLVQFSRKCQWKWCNDFQSIGKPDSHRTGNVCLGRGGQFNCNWQILSEVSLFLASYKIFRVSSKKFVLQVENSKQQGPPIPIPFENPPPWST